MKKTTVGLLTLAATAAFAGTAEAQIPLPNFTPFSVEVRGGAGFPTGDLGDEDLGGGEPDFAASGSVTYHALPVIGIYGGYSYNRFGVDGVDDAEYVHSGFSAGVRAGIPTPLLPIDPWVKAGAVYNTFEASGFADAEINGESDREWGFEVGGGLGLPLGPKVSITPGVTYTSVSYGDEDADLDVDISHVTVDVGLRIRI